MYLRAMTAVVRDYIYIYTILDFVDFFCLYIYTPTLRLWQAKRDAGTQTWPNSRNTPSKTASTVEEACAE